MEVYQYLSLKIVIISSQREITEEILRIRKSIMKKTVNVDDLTGSTFTVSGLDHTSAARFTPIIHPRQGAIIGVPSIQRICHEL